MGRGDHPSESAPIAPFAPDPRPILLRPRLRAQCNLADAGATQSFITFMDALKLNLRAKDQLHPFLTELMSGYSRFKGSGEWEGRGKILHW
jgi:hypothetical protein